MSSVSRISCFSEGVTSEIPVMKSASADAELRFSIAAASSAGTCGKSCIASRDRSLSSRMRASISGVITSVTPISSTRATR